MKILVMGAGAVGSFVGALLALAGHELTLVRLGAPALERATLSLIGPDGTMRSVETRLRPAAPDRGGPGGDPDLIVLGVKMFNVEDALAACESWPAVPVLTIQNGIGAEEAVATRRPGAGSVAASLTAPIELAADGAVRQLGPGGIGLSTFAGDASALVERLVADLRRTGMPAAVCADASSMKWSKLLGNLVGNATSAVLDMDPGAIYARSDLFAVERAQILETLAVMRALGRRPVALPGAAVPWLARAFRLPPPIGRTILARVAGGARGGKQPSLRLSVRRGEAPTEVCWLNGAVAAAGERTGVRTPVNARLAALVDEAAADATRRDWLRGRPDRLLAEIAGRA